MKRAAQASPAARAAEIERSLRGRADAAYLEQITRLVPGIRTLGVRVPAIREVVAEHVALSGKAPLAETVVLVDALVARGSRDAFLFGVFLLGKHGKAVAGVEWAAVLRWVEHVDNWETCDQLAMVVGAPVVGASGDPIGHLLPLAGRKSPARAFSQRFALATSAALNQKGRAMPEVAVKIVEAIGDVADPGLRKAMGWALREASGRDPKLVADFLVRSGDALPRSVVREGAAKLPSALAARVSAAARA